MEGAAEQERGEGFREAVRFYLVDHETLPGKLLDVALLSLNLIFVGLFVADTYPVSPGIEDLLWSMEVVLALVFLVEYVLRLYGSRSRTGFVTDPYAVADLSAILPTLLLLVPGLGFAAAVEVLQIARVARVLRFFRFASDPAFFFGRTTMHALRLLRLVLTVLTIFFVSSGLFYHVEHAVNPGVNNFGDAFYFTVVTLTTVGFGDITPATEAGRWVTVLSIIGGIVLIPWQVSKIVREWMAREKVDVTCPNCGLRFHDPDASHCKACGEVIYQEYDSRRDQYLR